MQTTNKIIQDSKAGGQTKNKIRNELLLLMCSNIVVDSFVSI